MPRCPTVAAAAAATSGTCISAGGERAVRADIEPRLAGERRVDEPAPPSRAASTTSPTRRRVAGARLRAEPALVEQLLAP